MAAIATFAKQEGPILDALRAVEERIAAAEIDAGLMHLIKLRASQINQCHFCVNMHVREALEDGDSAARLHDVVVFRQSDRFDEREKAALAWTEALTDLERHDDIATARAALDDHFDQRQINALISVIAMINLWNRLNVGLEA